MAANYWESTQRRHWQFTKPGLEGLRSKLEEDDPSLLQMYPLPGIRNLSIFFNQQINRLGKRLQIRQQAMATAQLYIRRFYTKVEIRKTNPYLVIATAVYLACKMEECPQHIRLVVSEARQNWPDFITQSTSRLGECEFFLISEMNSQMIVHHPYRSLTTIQGSLPFTVTSEETNLAWSILNDHYMTDLPLLYAPHIIAVTAILLALVLRPMTNGSSSVGSASNMAGAAATALSSMSQPGQPGTGQKKSKVQALAQWLAESSIDIEGTINCVQEMISFYDVQEQYNEKLTKESINRFVKARGLDK